MRGRAAFRIACTSFASALALCGAPGDANAATRLDAKFVELLAHRGARRHPLADSSGRLPLVVEVSPNADPRAQGFLPLSSGLAAVHVAPRDLPSFVTAHPGAHFSIWPGLHPVLDQSARLNRTTDYRAALAAAGSTFAGTGKGVVVGIVDTGCDAFHADFRTPTGQTRIAWMLDFARPPIGVHPELEATFGCTTPGQSICAVLDQNDIDRAIASGGTALLSDDPVGHGTHVTSIAAGNGGGDGRFVGGAPEATLIVAQVAHGGTGGTVADIDVITAARFIFEQAEKMGMPAVVNVSLGGDFGPHDGTTPLEVSLAELVGPAHPGRSIVVAAGNSGTIYQGDEPEQVLGIHTETRVTGGADAKINVFTPDAKEGSDVSGSVLVWLTYGATDSIRVGLRGPNGLSIPPVSIGRTGGYQAKDDSLTAAIYNGAVGGDSPLPATSHGAILVWDGKWPASGKMTLDLEGEGFVNAWVEATFDDALSAGGVYFDLAIRAGTISVPATHPDLIAVGCTNNRTEWTDSDGFAHDLAATAYRILAPVDASCYFSSAGPTATGIMKPDLSAPGAMVAAAMSRAAVPAGSSLSAFSAPAGLCPDNNECLVVDSGHALLSGSSMSSPQVAGAIALLFERDPRLTQPEILRILQGGARRPDAPINADYQLGPGALDVAGAASVEASRTTPIVREPDAAASWLSLSNTYVKPVSDGSLVGMVAVRAADRSIADDFDEARLKLRVSGEAVIAEPLTRIASGLYRFALGAKDGTGSDVMDLAVEWDGVPIGEPGTRLSGRRVVPIGADRWIASGSARAYGGCSIERSSVVPITSPSRAWATTCVAAALFAIRRFRRRIPKGDPSPH